MGLTSYRIVSFTLWHFNCRCVFLELGTLIFLADFTFEYIQREGLRDPIIFEKADGLGIQYVSHFIPAFRLIIFFVSYCLLTLKTSLSHSLYMYLYFLS